jgi:phenylacetic acid degradation operon negative regulatory protein
MTEAAPARDDLEATTGSATALLRTVVGSVLRPIGGWMSAGAAVRLMGDLGIPAATARSSLARLCARGVLRREPRDAVAGYALDPAAVPMLEQGDARIFGPRSGAAAWCLVSFSFPERERGTRNRLRRRLAALGCGTVADGLWIAPASLEDQLAAELTSFGADPSVILFADAAARGDLSAGLERWYDLPLIRRTHESFVARFADAPAPRDDAEAFAQWMRILDEWRVIPYRDPGLPAHALPADWPGAASAALFERLRTSLEQRAVAHAAAVVGPDRTLSPTR